MFRTLIMAALFVAAQVQADERLNLGLEAEDFEAGKTPKGWRLRAWSPRTWGARAFWVIDQGIPAVKLESQGNLVFLEKTVDIDLRRYPWVSWCWKVENVLAGIDERSKAGDDHPLRLFFALAPNVDRQSFWFRLKRLFYLDLWHGHPVGGRYTEYLWSSHLEPGSVIKDPGMPAQKLLVIEGGEEKLGRWLSYRRNLYQDFKKLYGEEPGRLVYIGILNDTDQTGLAATSYISRLRFDESVLR